MSYVKMIIDACTSIMTTRIDLFGYHVSLLQVVVYSFIVSCILWIIFRLTY